MPTLTISANVQYKIYVRSFIDKEDIQDIKTAATMVTPQLFVDLFGKNMRRDESLAINLKNAMPDHILDKYAGKKFKDILNIVDLADTKISGLTVIDEEKRQAKLDKQEQEQEQGAKATNG